MESSPPGAVGESNAVRVPSPVHPDEPEHARPASLPPTTWDTRGLRRLDPGAARPARNASGAGLPLSPWAAIARPSIQPSTSAANPVTPQDLRGVGAGGRPPRGAARQPGGLQVSPGALDTSTPSLADPPQASLIQYPRPLSAASRSAGPWPGLYSLRAA